MYPAHLLRLSLGARASVEKIHRCVASCVPETHCVTESGKMGTEMRHKWLNYVIYAISLRDVHSAADAYVDAQEKGQPVKPHASFRLFRSGLIGSIILGLAAGGHLAGGGALPTPAILAALCAVTMVPVAALTRFKLSFPALIGLLGGGQAWLHWAFDAMSQETSTAVSPALLSEHAGHTSGVWNHDTLLMAAPAHGSAPDGLMFAAHAVATLVTALLLARGERALGVLADWLSPLFRHAEPAAVVPVGVPAPYFAAVLLPPKHHSLRLPSRRGPPLPAAAA
jgi:hypothetical protein